MSRGPQKFRQTDIVKAVKATKAAGLNVLRIEINPDGKIVVVPGHVGASADPVDVNEWDSVE
jgi:hypothetical protein